MRWLVLAMGVVLSGCLATPSTDLSAAEPASEASADPLTTSANFALELGEARNDGAVRNFGMKPNCAHIREGSGILEVTLEMRWTPESPLAEELRVFALEPANVAAEKAGPSPLTFTFRPADPEAELMFGTGTAQRDGLVVAQPIQMSVSFTHSHALADDPYAHSCGVGGR